MNTEYLKDIRDVNLELLPPLIHQQYELVRFKFDIKRSGAYYIRHVLNDVYCITPLVYSSKKLEPRVLFNKNASQAQDAYEDGYHHGFSEPDFLIGIIGIENQVHEIFAGVYKIYEKIRTPHLLEFKANPHAYNRLYFLEKHFYEYGVQVGHFIRCWTIILNNPILFEDIFDKHFASASKSKPETDKMYFKVGLLFAEKKLYKKTTEIRGIKIPSYVYLGQEFESINKLAKHSALSRQYINDSFNDSDSHHNIFRNIKFMRNILQYCKKNAITPHPDFLQKFKKLEEMNL